MALHYADWGDKYFGARMDADALATPGKLVD